MKKIFGIAVSLVLALCAISAYAQDYGVFDFSDEVTNVIQLLEIANGDENGNMNYDEMVTRAQFVKMAVCASSFKDEAVSTNLNVTLFYDVKSNHWGAGYISTAIKSGLINGYLDGTFRPQAKVKLEEAATVVLKLLGYTSADFLGPYPYSQLEKYKNLELDEGIFAQQGDELTRAECMKLLYNALSAKTKQGAVYCTTLGYPVNNEGVIDYTGILSAKTKGPVVVTDNSSWQSLIPFEITDNTKIMLGGESVNSTDIAVNDVIYYAKHGNLLWVFRETASGVISACSDSTVTLGSKSYALATNNAKYKVSAYGEFGAKDYVTLLLGKNNEVVDIYKASLNDIGKKDNDTTYSEVVLATLKGPYIAEAGGNMPKLPFDAEIADIFNESTRLTAKDVREHDVYYYSELLSAVWIYREAVTGTIEAVTPVSSPANVVVAGKTYSIESSDASYNLSSLGFWHVGDDVTLLMGKDGVAGVISPNAHSLSVYGIITDMGTKTFTKKDGTSYSADYITVTDTKNQVYTYEYDNRYLSKGSVVKVSYEDGIKLAVVPAKSNSKGVAQQLKEAIYEGRFTDNCEIIDVEKNGTLTVKIFPSRIKGLDIDIYDFTFGKGIVLYHSFNDEGQIEKLILNGFTGDMYDYGVAYPHGQSTTRYMTQSVEMTYSSEGRFNGPVCVKDGGATLVAMQSHIGVEEITKSAVYDKNGNEYKLSSNVKVYLYDGITYKYANLEDVINENYRFEAYYDKSINRGGLVRVIVAYRA